MNKQNQPRVLVFSQRNLSTIQPFRCPHFEFEDVIEEVDDIDLLAPRFDPNTRRQTIAKELAYHTPFRLNPGIEPVSVASRYELFLAICGNPTDLLRIHSCGNWRSKCRTAVCLIDELWVRQMEDYDNYLRMLDKFDLVVLYYSGSIEPLNRRIGRKCMFVPPGVDTPRFCPWPYPPQRSIDVYSMGRRSAVTHRVLLRMAEELGFFYIYDSTSSERVLDSVEHRQLFASQLKRSRYFIVNPGLIDRPDIRGDQIEIGNRYFEGAAAGSILVGQRPENAEFDRLFDWPGALADVPYDSDAIYELIAELDRDPDKQEETRRLNASQALLRHDWLYRWEAILGAVGMDLLPKAQARKERLRDLAELISPGISHKPAALTFATRQTYF